MSKALLNAAQVAGLIGQRRRAYSPDRTEWMDYVVLRPAYGGRVWVRRHTLPGAGATYDVFDERGHRVDRVVLPARTWLVGFGAYCIYVVRLDENDLSHLGRLPL